jgi:hypothetical protein
MVVSKLQKGLINSCIVPRASMVNCQKKKFKWEHILFFSNSDRDFHSENNGVSQVYTYMTKNKKKKLKNATIAMRSILR